MSSQRPTASEEPAQLAPGDVLARKYRLLEPLGEGGMAVVWVAQNIALETRVAVKILRASLASDVRLVARVRQEAKATAAIAHKNIVQVYDYGVTGWGAPFIVMELLQGETLAARLKTKGRLEASEAVRILLRAMKGITVAHAKGIIHRDLKPENVFLAIEDNGTERPKVLDFGVSFVARASGDDRLTRAGGMVGTPSYLPPEAIEGDNRGDARGDVWALGVMLHEMVTGTLPFGGRNVHALLESIVHDPPPAMDTIIDGVDPGLQDIVNRAMAKDPANRYPGVREMFDDLNVWLGSQDAGVSSSRMPSGRLALASDPNTDDGGPTFVGPSLERPAQGATPGPAPLTTPTPTPTPFPTSATFATSVRRQPTARAGAGPQRTPEGSATLRGGDPSPLRRTRSRRPESPSNPRLTWVLLAGGLTALGVSLWVASHKTPLGAGAGAGPSAAPSASASAGGGRLDDASLDILMLPPGAAVRIDGKRVELPARVPRGATLHLRVEAPGFLPWTQDVSAEGTVRLSFAGVPAAVEPPPPAASSAPPPQRSTHPPQPLPPQPGVPLKDVPY